jgi:hypothetical protein
MEASEDDLLVNLTAYRVTIKVKRGAMKVFNKRVSVPASRHCFLSYRSSLD